VNTERVAVRVGEVRVAAGNTVLFAVGLGSCVGIALYDARARIGGFAHVMLPHPSSARKPTPLGRFASTAIEYLIQEMETAGAARRRLYARLVGGAAMFENLMTDNGPALGERNVESARHALKAAGVPLKGEAVGGNHGRSVHFDMANGRLLVTSVRHPDVIL
jgi:chemotaxis protein CheD